MPAQIPTFWREEVYHPLTVHFPLALLTAGSVVEVTRIWLREGRFAHILKNAAAVMILLGAFTSWASIYTGGVAEDVVNKIICDPTATNAHEATAWYTTYLFSFLASVFVLRDLLIARGKISFSALSDYQKWAIRLCWAALMIGGLVLLFRTGHSGAELVYQQGAGTYRASESCEEFE